MVTKRKPEPQRRPTVRKQASQRSPGQQAARVSGRPPAMRQPVRSAPVNLSASGISSLPPYVLVAAGVVAVIAILAIVLAVGSCSQADNESGASGANGAAGAELARVSFVAVGDNLPNENIGRYADTLAGEEGDGVYDYAPIYEPIKPYVESADLAYIDQETHLGGDDIGPRGWPSFNTTDSMADAVVSTGFDFVASATNHSYDWGMLGALDNSLAVWDQQPVAFTGTAVTAEQYNRIAMQEREGITFALLNYTYGVNGFEQSDLPEYAVNFIDEDRIASDVARAREEGADVVLVAMHWGTENLVEADDEQLRLAQFLADLDVDVVLGSHPHVIGPMAWVDNSTGSGHRTLVAYSLGNFLADHAYPEEDNVLEGMLACDFVRLDEGGPVTVENVKWVPLVCHSSEDQWDFAVYAVDDYPEDLAKQCRAIDDMDDPVAWLQDRSREIVGDEWF